MMKHIYNNFLKIIYHRIRTKLPYFCMNGYHHNHHRQANIDHAVGSTNQR